MVLRFYYSCTSGLLHVAEIFMYDDFPLRVLYKP